MHYESIIIALLAAIPVSAVPPNINLDACSPALVVGDGEISFGSGTEAEALVNTLVGASVGTEGAAAAANGITRAGETSPTISTSAEATSPSPSASSLPSGISGIGRSISGIEPQTDIADMGVEKRDLAGFNAALHYATGALKMIPGVELGAGEGVSGIRITIKLDGAIAKREDGALATVALLSRSYHLGIIVCGSCDVNL
jgi:hypothetical protein